MENQDIILAGCMQRDRNSQEKLYRAFYPGLFSLCNSFFDNDHDVLTALNNGMLIVYRKIDQYDASKGQLFNWAYTIVRNAALTYLKSKNSKTSHEEITEIMMDFSLSSPFEKLEEKDIYVHISQLPVNIRISCVLFYLEGFSIREIVQKTNTREGTVKWHLNESRTRLKHLLINKTVSKSA